MKSIYLASEWVDKKAGLRPVQVLFNQHLKLIKIMKPNGRSVLRELDLKQVINTGTVSLFSSNGKTFCLSMRIPKEFCDLVNKLSLFYSFTNIEMLYKIFTFLGLIF